MKWPIILESTSLTGLPFSLSKFRNKSRNLKRRKKKLRNQISVHYSDFSFPTIKSWRGNLCHSLHFDFFFYNSHIDNKVFKVKTQLGSKLTLFVNRSISTKRCIRTVLVTTLVHFYKFAIINKILTHLIQSCLKWLMLSISYLMWSLLDDTFFYVLVLWVFL